MAVVALKPRRGYSFADHATANPSVPPPGDRLDGEVDRIHAAIAQLIDFLGVSHNPDGTLKTAPVALSTRVGVLGGSETHVIIGADPTATALDWAETSFEWAEHMPDTIPPNILATMGITGDHWSSRWWANRALQIVEAATGGLGVAIGAVPPPDPGLGALWWCVTDGQLYIFYADPTSNQWVPATNQQDTLTLISESDPALVVTPFSGATLALTDFRPVYVNNAAPLAALTVRMPPAPAPGHTVEIGSKSAINVLTLQTDTGAAIAGAPISAYGPGAALQMRFDTPGWIYWK